MPATLDNKRVAKNAVTLYFRMLFQMVVYLYTSRVVIQVLGLADYGIYDVVGGVVTIFMFLNNSMTACTQRFITFAIGRGDEDYLRKVYSVSFYIHLLLACGIIFVGETGGLWYLHHIMNIPAERFEAALWVYHSVLLSSAMMIINVPYMSVIIAHERMTAFAGITILDVLLKLGVVLLLPYIGCCDKLIAYAGLLAVETLLLRIVYALYCRWAFRHLFLVWVREGALYHEMMGFAGWSTFGNLALVGNTQGLNLILNWFGGALLNAARGAAFQVQTAIMAFTASFQTAVNPQITKSYACQDLKAMNKLILGSSKFSFFLLLFIVVPLGLELDTVLHLWLPSVPEYAVAFTRLLLCVSMVDVVANPMMIGAAATGRIKTYHIVIGSTLLFTLPLSLLLIRLTHMPEIVFVTQLFMIILAQVFRMLLCRSLYQFSVSAFMRETLWPMVKVFVLSSLLPVALHICMTDGVVKVLTVGVANAAALVVTVYLCGTTPGEKNFILSKIRRR